MPDQSYDIAVIGGGIVGLSTALHATRLFPRLGLLLVEKESAVARHQSGHNSGVIHSGIYYQPGSLKARLCVEGAAAMVAFCREHNLPHQICGKLIVAAASNEIPRLEALYARGQSNGLSGLKVLNQEQIRDIEPHAGGVRGLHVPSTGITDYAAVCEKYAELITKQGGTIRTSTEVRKIVPANTTVLETTAGAFQARYIINCAGLQSDRLSRQARQEPTVTIVPFRGEYYDLTPAKRAFVRGLIYPVPDPRFPFLGVHLTRRINGSVDAGPNAVLAFKREGYRRSDFNLFDTLRLFSWPGFWRMAAQHWRFGAAEFYRSFNKAAFVRAVQKLLPEITSSDLVSNGSGVRAQALARDGMLVDDFQFVGSANMLHVCNVPSPAATASLPIGREVVRMAKESFALK